LLGYARSVQGTDFTVSASVPEGNRPAELFSMWSILTVPIGFPPLNSAWISPPQGPCDVGMGLAWSRLQARNRRCHDFGVRYRLQIALSQGCRRASSNLAASEYTQAGLGWTPRPAFVLYPCPGTGGGSDRPPASISQHGRQQQGPGSCCEAGGWRGLGPM